MESPTLENTDPKKDTNPFMRKLPDSCPIQTGDTTLPKTLCRFIKGDIPNDDDFIDWDKENPKIAGEQICGEMCISLFLVGSRRYKSIIKSKRIIDDYKKIAIINIDDTMGVINGSTSKKGRGHYDWWRYKNVNPLHHIIDIQDFKNNED